MPSKHQLTYLLLCAFIVGLYFVPPLPRFQEACSTVIYAREGKLLGAKIAADEQWRFPVLDSVPAKFTQCITLFEDQWFPYHFGLNPASLWRAARQNMRAGHVVSGGSTLTMQTVRLARKGKARTWRQKLIEMYFATRYESKYSKDEILQLYASYAPFGGNVVGLEAAAWRYFGRSPDNLSWAETATLAVLPNAPALIYPGRNQDELRAKRNRLLKKLLQEARIDTLTYQLSIQEALPQRPRDLPQLAPHLLDEIEKNTPGQAVRTTLSYHQQVEARRLLNNHSKHLATNEIHNAAALIIDNRSGNILAYIGNSDFTQQHANAVDIIQAPRSSGSILKPFLFAAMLQQGELLPNTLVPDIPVFYEGFTPQNYSRSYDGAVPATRALSRSLNIPAVYMLKQFTVDRFYNLLRSLHFSTLHRPASHYGLSLILGGAEVTLWDVTRAYAGMARTLSSVVEQDYRYASNNFDAPCYDARQKPAMPDYSKDAPIFSAAAIWSTFEALQEVNRPDNQQGWESFASAQRIAWKTGTSYGFRDAWAVGVSPQYTIGVWVGNADGEGRPGLTGVNAAAPLLFNLFSLMQTDGWFQEPYDEFIRATVCHESGYLASPHCAHVDTVSLPANGLRTPSCPYHQTIHLDQSEQFRVNSRCANPADIVHKSWFVLPPVMAYYYQKKHAFYQPLPPFKPGCLQEQSSVMDFIYPQENSRIYLPIDSYGKRGEAIFEVAHQDANSKLFWHLDREYLGTTQHIHQMAIQTTEGKHKLTVVDEKGNSMSRSFQIVSP